MALWSSVGDIPSQQRLDDSLLVKHKQAIRPLAVAFLPCAGSQRCPTAQGPFHPRGASGESTPGMKNASDPDSPHSLAVQREDGLSVASLGSGCQLPRKKYPAEDTPGTLLSAAFCSGCKELLFGLLTWEHWGLGF